MVRIGVGEGARWATVLPEMAAQSMTRVALCLEEEQPIFGDSRA